MDFVELIREAKMKSTEFGAWLKEVDEELTKKNKELYTEALNITLKELGNMEPDERDIRIYGQNASSPIIVMREDEPFGCFESGETPTEYAKFLIEEWELYGPEGE